MKKLNLFFNLYNAGDRKHEIETCLLNNTNVFDRVVIVKGRPTFSELFALTKDYPNDINCFCNSDIYFQNIELLQKLQPNECYAITRNDLVSNSRINFQSQDAWCFNGVVKDINADFHQGKWGCDNRLAHEIKEAGYTLINPCNQINLVHLHKVDNRVQERTKENTIPPPYHFVYPSQI